MIETDYADLYRLIEAVRGSRMAQALYECRAWLGVSSLSNATAADSDAAIRTGWTDKRNAAIIEIIPPVSRPL
jgi:hypothetical protein